MRALVKAGNELRLACRAEPSRPPGGAIVGIEAVGLCGTDHQLLTGERPGEATVLGHEGVGTILEIDPALEGLLTTGERVVFNPVDPREPGRVLGHSYDGLLQDVLAVRADDIHAGLLVPTRSTLPLRILTLAEPLATTIYGLDVVAHIREPGRMLVMGTGTQALLRAYYAAQHGWDIRIVTRREARAQWLAETGILPRDAVFTSPGLPEDALAWTNGQGVDAAAVCVRRSSTRRALDAIWPLLSDGGVVELVSAVEDVSGAESPHEIPAADLNAWRAWNTCGLAPPVGRDVTTPAGRTAVMTGHRGTDTNHITRALAELTRHPDHYDRLITNRAPLEHAGRLFHQIAQQRDAPVDVIKVVIEL